MAGAWVLGLISLLPLATSGSSQRETVASVTIPRLGDEPVLEDVHMPDMTGCDVLDACGFDQLPVVIFVTAHDQYAIEAFDRDAVDYLLKPFDERRFRDAMTRARRELGAGRPDSGRGAAGRSCDRRFVSRLAVHEHGRIVLVKTADIETIEAAGNYVALRSAGETHLARIGMAALETRLDPDRFVRIHRSTIVNLDYVREVRPWSGGEQMLVLADGRELTIGRVYRRGIVDALASAIRPAVVRERG
jgi:two-component system LytT family response regulator